MPGFLTDAFGSGVKSAGLAAGAIGLLAALVPMVVLLMVCARRCACRCLTLPASRLHLQDNVKFIKPAAITYFCGSLLYFAVLGVAIKQLLSFIDQPFTEKSKLSDMIETNLPELAVKYAASSLVYSLGCWIAVDFIIVATCTYYMNAYRVFKAKLAEYEEKMGGMAHGGIVVAMGLGGPGAANKV